MANLKGDSNTPQSAQFLAKTPPRAVGYSGKGGAAFVGESDSFQGVFGKSIENAGVGGESTKLHSVFGVCHNPHGAVIGKALRPLAAGQGLILILVTLQ